MRKTIAAFLLGLISFVAYADTSIIIDKPVICSDPKTVIETVSGPDWKEQPVWVGLGETDSKYVMMVNSKTKTWSMVQFTDTIACIVGSGKSSNLINFNKIKTLVSN
jgi:hypothetical protein